MKKTIMAAAVLVALTACNKSIIETSPAEAGYGYINLGVTADTEMVVTKSSAPDLSGYNICLYKHEGQTKTPYWTTDQGATEGFLDYSVAMNGETKENLWKVPAGTYSIYAENKNISEIYSSATSLGEVRVSDEKQVTVFAGLPTETVNVNCTPKNTKVSFVYNSEFDAVFDVVSLNVTNSTEENVIRNLSMEPTLVSGELTDEIKNNLAYAFYESELLTWTLVAENTAGVSKRYSATLTPEVAKWSIVTFTTGDIEGTINVTITVDDSISVTQTVTAEIDPTKGDEVVSE